MRTAILIFEVAFVVLALPFSARAQDTTWVEAGEWIELRSGPGGIEGTLLDLDSGFVILRTPDGDTLAIHGLEHISLRVLESRGMSGWKAALTGMLVGSATLGFAQGLSCGGCLAWDPYTGITGALLGGLGGLIVAAFHGDDWRDVERPWRSRSAAPGPNSIGY